MTENEVLKAIGALTLHLEQEVNDIEKLVERGRLYMKIERRDLALNDFNRVLAIDSEHIEANSYVLLLSSIDDYFYNQTYNV
ncbi:MAG: hypothetical protein RR550_02005 [Rikenellaceae bacterium]